MLVEMEYPFVEGTYKFAVLNLNDTLYIELCYYLFTLLLWGSVSFSNKKICEYPPIVDSQKRLLHGKTWQK